MSSDQSIVAVLCDHQCSQAGPLKASQLEKRLSAESSIGKLIVLHEACRDQEKKLKMIEGKKVLFAGCPYLEESGFYETAGRALGLGRGEMLTVDVKSSIIDLYENRESIEENLVRKLESLGKMLAENVEVKEQPIKLKRSVLVYGSGFSGLQAALELSGEKLSVDLIETQEQTLAPGCLTELLRDPDMVNTLAGQARSSEHIAFFPSETIRGVESVEQGFSVTYDGGQKREYGAVVFSPERIENPVVETGAWNLTQLYQKLVDGQSLKGRIVFLLDRFSETPPEILQDVLHGVEVIKKRFASDVWILLKQVRVALPGLEELYDSCREKGIIFVKYENLSLKNDFGDFEIEAKDSQTGEPLRISKPDRLVLPDTTGLSGAARSMAEKLGLRLFDGMYTQPYSLWRLTSESNRPGVFVCGSARSNLDAAGVRSDSSAMVMGLKERFGPGGNTAIEHIAVVDNEKCAYCLTCLRVCPFGAVAKDTEERVARIIDTVCQGCGICASECPAEAIEMRNLTRQSIQAGMKVLV